MNMPKYKLLVLTDLSKNSNTALENAVNLSKIIGGSVDVFHVLKSSDITEYENQFSAMRCIDEERMSKKSKLKDIARAITKKSGVTIRSRCILGNLKDETLEHIKATKPDIIVLGKRTPKLVNLIGDGFTKFILNKFDGSVLISGKEKAFSTSEILSLGMLNTTEDELPFEMANDLRKHIKSPIKRFYIHSDKDAAKQTVKTGENVVTYEFASGSNTMNTIAKYITKSNIGLLCINQNKGERLSTIKSNFKDAIQKINVPILIVNNKSSIQLQ